MADASGGGNPAVTTIDGRGHNTSGLLRGRAGVKNKRTQEGEDYARLVLFQDVEDIVVERTEGGDEVIIDRNQKALEDPVLRELRAQMRSGVGTMPGQLPPAVYNALMDRACGKVVERVKLGGGRPYAGETEEQLQERLDKLQAALARPRAKVEGE